MDNFYTEGFDNFFKSLFVNNRVEDDDSDYEPELVILRITNPQAPVTVDVVVDHDLYHQLEPKLSFWAEEGIIGDFTVTSVVVHDKALLESLINTFIVEHDVHFDDPTAH